MSWFNTVIAGMALMLLAGCATTDGERAAYKDELGKVTVVINDTRSGQLYRQKLDRLLGRYGLAESRYELRVTLNTASSSDAVDMSASIALYDRTVGKDVMNKSLASAASIGAVPSLYGSEEAKRHARERLAATLAEKTYHALMLYFARSTAES